MKNNNLIIFYLLIVLIIQNTCRKQEKEMMVATEGVTNILRNSVNVSGMVVDLGTGALQCGHCYATAPYVTIDNSKTQLGAPIDTGAFTSQLTNLVAGTTYYTKAYISNGNKTVYGNEISFSTLPPSATAPTITTTAIASITSNSAGGGGNIINDGGAIVTARGVCWGTSSSPPTIADSKTTDGSGAGVFSSNITELQSCTQYYVRAYATNQYGTAYGAKINFTTKGLPTVTTTSVSGITNNLAISGGNVTTDCGSAVIARGVCWNTSPNPTTDNSKTSDASGSGAFSSYLTSLQACTQYYVRAYATNQYGTVYGNEIFFTTYGLPTVSTTSVTDITNNSATSGGNVTSDCGSTVTVRGVCWSTSPNPTTDNSKTTDHKFTGVFSSSLTGLQSATQYFVRAYATNEYGTVYGNEVNFTTNP